MGANALDTLLIRASDKDLLRVYGPGHLKLDLNDLVASRLAVFLFDSQERVESLCVGGRVGWTSLWPSVLYNALISAQDWAVVEATRAALLRMLNEACEALDEIDIRSCMFPDTAEHVRSLVSLLGSERVHLWTQWCPRHQVAKVQNSGVLDALDRALTERDIVGGNKFAAIQRDFITLPPNARVVFFDDSPSIHQKLANHLGDDPRWLSVRVQTGRHREVQSPICGAVDSLHAEFWNDVLTVDIPEDEAASRVSLSVAPSIVSTERAFSNLSVFVRLDCDGTLWDNAKMRVLQARALLPFLVRSLEA